MTAACSDGQFLRTPIETAPAGPAAKDTKVAEAVPVPTLGKDTVAGPSPSGFGVPYRQRGSGVFIDRGVAEAAVTRDDESGRTAINFQDAPLRDVVAAILGDVLGVPYVIDPDLDGTISLQTNGDLPSDALIPILERTLMLNGFALFRADGVYQITDLDSFSRELGSGPVMPAPERGLPGFGISVVTMRYASVTEIRELIEPFVSDAVTVQADANRNLFLIAGSGPARSNVQDLIETFDVDWMAGMSLGMYPLDNADASTVAQELEFVFSTEFGPLTDVIRFVPVERLNAVLVIAHEGSYLAQVEDWLVRLDSGSGENGGRSLHIYKVQNGRASDLAQVLGQLFGAAAGDGRTDDEPPLARGLDPATLSTEPDSDDDSRIDPLRQPGATVEAFAGGDDGLRLIADNTNNALVILGTPSEHRLIQSALRQLDVPPLQVLIEATIAEVTLNEELRYGLQWFFKSGDSEFTLSNIVGGAVAPTFPAFSYILDTADDVRLVLEALESVTDVQVLSSPQLTVLNNQPAVLQVGDQVPVITRSAVSLQDDTSPVVNSVEFRDTGVILNVIPRVNDGGLVLIDIEQEVSTVARTNTSDIDSPTINQRRIRTSVAVQSGETIALGGLIQETVEQTDRGIPLISRIPLMGNLFKSNLDDVERKELLVLLTPRVIRNLQDTRQITAELRAKMRSIKAIGSDAE